MADPLFRADPRRLADWKRISGYARRPVAVKGEHLDVVRRPVPGPPALAGRVAAFLSDLHWNEPSGLGEELESFLQRLVPDWIILGGDLVSNACHFDSAIALIRRLEAKHDKIAVLGNWDRLRSRWFPLSAWRDGYRDAGFNLLVNESIRSEGILFMGVDDCKLGAPERPPTRTAQGETLFSCLITHNPDWVVDADEDQMADVDLVLAGHTHGGQVRIPGFGALETSSKYWKKFEYGLYQRRSDGTRMIVSSGLGVSAVPFRFQCRPEIVLVEFTS